MAIGLTSSSKTMPMDGSIVDGQPSQPKGLSRIHRLHAPAQCIRCNQVSAASNTTEGQATPTPDVNMTKSGSPATGQAGPQSKQPAMAPMSKE